MDIIFSLFFDVEVFFQYIFLLALNPLLCLKIIIHDNCNYVFDSYFHLSFGKVSSSQISSIYFPFITQSTIQDYITIRHRGNFFE